MVLEQDRKISLSVSATTRPKRPGETHGKDYCFVDNPHFQKMVDEGAFLEWADVFGYRYGTPREPVEVMLANEQDVLFDIDWQGAQQLHQEAGADVVRVFILPPTMDELERRLHARQTDSDTVIATRMSRAANEISHWDGYDYVLINDAIETCLHEVQVILSAERLKRHRRVGLTDFTRSLIRSV